MEEINGKSALIVGYGREGQSVHRFLLAHHPNLKIGIADIAKIKPIDKNVDLHLGKDYLEDIEKYDVLIRSPGISSSLPQLKNFTKAGKIVTSATNIFFSISPGVIVGVTGTKGKSTTSSLIADVLASELNDVRLVGNIGRPALDYLKGADRKTIFVCELSSQQLEDLRYSPHVAVVHAIYPEHLDSHKTFGQYLSAKSNIVKFQETGDFVIFNAGNTNSSKLGQMSLAKKIPFASDEKYKGLCFIRGDSVFLKEDHRKKHILERSDIPLLGPGNIENVLAVVCVASLFKISSAKIKQIVKKFKSLPHRLEFVANVNGIKFYNDSQATNPMAVINALEGLSPDVGTLIIGGYDRGLDLTQLGKYIALQNIQNLILFPTTGEKIWSIIASAKIKGRSFRKFKANSMQEAVDIAFANTPKGKTCLLSPGAASFGLFKNYEERGNLFREFVLSKK